MAIADTFPSGLRVLQVVGSLRIAEQRRILLADQPGAGKTAQALVGLELAGLFARPSRILILCNVTGCQLTWAGELAHRVATQYPVTITDLTDTAGKKTMPSVARRDAALAAGMIEANLDGTPHIVLANYELLRWAKGKDPKLTNLFRIQWDAVIIDEAHLVLPTKEDNSNKLTQFWYGLTRLQITENAILLPITGTPDRGKLENRYGHWKFLHPTGHKSFWSWAQANFVLTPQPWGGVEIGKMRQPQRWAAYDAEHMIRRTKSEMLKGLPEKQWAGEGGIDLPMTIDQDAAYWDYIGYLEEKEKELLADDKANEAAGLKMQFALRARQMATCTWTFEETVDAGGHKHTHGVPIVAGPAHSNKLAWLLDWLSARGYTPDGFDSTLGKVVIVSFFTEVLHWLQAELAAAGVQSQVMDGATNSVDKKRIEEQFQRGSLRVVLLSGFLGVSINLDAADDMIFVDAVQDPDKMEQAEDRIHRASRNHQVCYWRLASINTADMVVLAATDARYRTTRATYDGNRGIQFARRMLSKTREEMSN